MRKSDKISIILPVFNRENCVGRCLESILAQTYRDIEIIIIDDGSTDHSGDICEQYRHADERIMVLHQSNSGVSSARNAGIGAATGKYLQFVDSDDTIRQDMCSCLVKRQEQTRADLVICGYNLCQNGREKEIPATDSFFHSMGGFSGEFYYYLTNYLLHSPWNKLFLREKVSVPFDVSCSLGEDLLFNLDYLANCRSIAGVASPLYNYNHTTSPNYRNDGVKAAANIYHALVRFTSQKFPQEQAILKGIYEIYINDMLYNIRMAFRGKKDLSYIRQLEQEPEFQNAVRDSRHMLRKSSILYRIDKMRLWPAYHFYVRIKNAGKNK